MVETLLSLILLVAGVTLALWPSLGLHDHTIDGLYMTVTGSMLGLIFLVNFIWQLRHQSAQEVAAIRHAWQRLAHAGSTLRLQGGAGMRTIPPKMSISLVMGIVWLLILAFPSKLNASVGSASQLRLVGSDNGHVLAMATPKLVPSTILRRGRKHSDGGLWLMDADVHLRAAAALECNPALEKVAESARVPLRIIVIAASPLLEV